MTRGEQMRGEQQRRGGGGGGLRVSFSLLSLSVFLSHLVSLWHICVTRKTPPACLVSGR